MENQVSEVPGEQVQKGIVITTENLDILKIEN